MIAPRQFLLAVVLCTVACHHGEPSDIEKRLDVISRAEMTFGVPERARLAGIQAAYAELAHAAGPLDHVSNRDLALLYDGAYREAFYVHDAGTIRDMAKFLDAMQERGIAAEDHYRNMYDTFAGARMFAGARALAKQHPVPDLEATPELREADLAPGQPTELAVDPNARVLLRRSVDLQPAQVVVVSHPQCHFSHNAMRDIEADPVLREAFLKHAKWLAPQHDNLEFDAIQRWNREHPEMEHAIAYRDDEWPMIDSWGTPTFYFFKDGAVRAKVEGWPKEGSRTELLAALRQVGLL
jgi:hypothetical protein